MSGAPKCRAFESTTPSSTSNCRGNWPPWSTTSKLDSPKNSLGRLGVGHDETRSRGPVEVTPRPVDHHAQTISKAHQIPQVQRQPGEPTGAAANDATVRQLRHGRTTSDG